MRSRSDQPSSLASPSRLNCFIKNEEFCIKNEELCIKNETTRHESLRDFICNQTQGTLRGAKVEEIGGKQSKGGGKQSKVEENRAKVGGNRGMSRRWGLLVHLQFLRVKRPFHYKISIVLAENRHFQYKTISFRHEAVMCSKTSSFVGI